MVSFTHDDPGTSEAQWATSGAAALPELPLGQEEHAGRASAYLAAGGFARIASEEDGALGHGLRSRAFAVTATHSNRVVTSGRTHARAPHGFGTYLRTPDREPPPPAG